MIDVYIASLPNRKSCVPLLCFERQLEVDGVSNERTRREKYYVWRLLEYAIKNSLGADASRLCFTKGKNRKWSCEGFEFSLSHSGEALAVAISDRAVGVDVERIRVRDVNRMAEYMLTESERAEYENVFDNERVEWLIRKWCQKEAIFKSFDEEIFAPKRIETAAFFTLVTDFELEDEKYILAVASQFESDVRIFNGIELLDK